jgi:hypothetical protein
MHKRHILILILLSACFYILGNNILPITSPDEVFYVQTAREMVKHNSWLTPYLFGLPQFEKPIFIYWLMRLEFILFGFSNFSVRFIFSLFGILGVIGVYYLGLVGFKDEKKAFISALVLSSSALYIGLSRIVMTDVVFSFFITLALLSFFYYYLRQNKFGLVTFFVFCAFAVLTKGPLGLILPFFTLVTFLLLNKDLRFLCSGNFLWGLICFALISLPWYSLIIYKHGWAFINEFFYNDHIRRILAAEHNNDTWYYYPLFTFAGIFPWSIFMLLGLKRLFSGFSYKQPFYLFLACWIGVVFCVFQIAHSKLLHYLLPAYPALALASGDFIYASLKDKGKILVAALSATAFIAFFSPFVVVVMLMSNSSILPVASLLFMAAILVIYGLLCLALILASKFEKLLYMFALICPMLIFFIFLIAKNISPYISTAQACQALLKNKTIENTILTSKYFARDVRYNTGKKIAIFYLKGKNFFSPHPVPFIDTYPKAKNLLSAQGQTYCILDRNSAQKLFRINSESFKVELIGVVGDKYILSVKYFNQENKPGER